MIFCCITFKYFNSFFSSIVELEGRCLRFCKTALTQSEKERLVNVGQIKQLLIKVAHFHTHKIPFAYLNRLVWSYFLVIIRNFMEMNQGVNKPYNYLVNISPKISGCVECPWHANIATHRYILCNLFAMCPLPGQHMTHRHTHEHSGTVTL